MFLASDLSARLPGEVLYLNSGFHVVGVQMAVGKEAGGE